MNLNSKLAPILESVTVNPFLLEFEHCIAQKPHAFKVQTKTYAFDFSDTFLVSHVRSAHLS